MRTLADKVWTKVLQCDEKTALRKLGLEKDFDCGEKEVSYIHRIYADDIDGYFVAMGNSEPKTFECSFRMTGRVPELWDAETGKICEAPVWRVENGRTHVKLSFPPSGSVFVMFHKPITGLSHANNEKKVVDVETIAVDGAWEVTFPSNRGAPASAMFEKLISWPEHDDNGIKYFSGTATYRKTVQVKRPLGASERMILDLGDVKDFAEVRVNGVRHPTLWKRLFEVDITDAVRKNLQELKLEVKITNRWANRLIGDDVMFAEDCKWIPMEGWRKGLAQIPDWVKAGKKSPTGRTTFTTWKHWDKTDALLPSGLLGPVNLRVIYDQ